MDTDIIKHQKYDTSLIDIACIKNFFDLYKVIKLTKENNFENLIKNKNLLNIKSISSRKKILWGVKRNFDCFINADHKDLFVSFFEQESSLMDKNLFVFWHLCIVNKMFRELTVYFLSFYYKNNYICKQNILEQYISDSIIKENFNLSDLTIYRIATKYLIFIKKLDFYSETKKLKLLMPSSNMKILFIYLYALSNNHLPIESSFFHEQDYIQVLKECIDKKYISMVDEKNIKTCINYGDICNELF